MTTLTSTARSVSGRQYKHMKERKIRKLPVVLLLGACVALVGKPTPVEAIVVLWTSPNTSVTLGMSFSELEFENPLMGTETVAGYSIIEWRDADFSYGPPRWYDDWSVSKTSIDGNPNEIWMRAAGHSIWTTTTVPGSIVSIHLTGDSNDGLADVEVDGVLVAQLDMGTPTCCDRAFILVTGLAHTTHTIKVRDQGVGQLGGRDVATFGAAVLAPPGIPVVSAWGVFIMMLLLLAGTKIYFGRHQKAAAGAI